MVDFNSKLGAEITKDISKQEISVVYGLEGINLREIINSAKKKNT